MTRNEDHETLGRIWEGDGAKPHDTAVQRALVSLGTSLNNITVRLHRGRRALRKRLEEMCRTCPIHGFLDCYCEKAEQIAAARAAISNHEKPPRDV